MYCEIEGSDELSPRIPIEAPGFAGEFMLKQSASTRGYCYVYSVSLSPASETIENLNTTILTVSPKYIIVNNTEVEI